jgi:phosphoserine phosphatase RsbU/P
MGAIYTILLAGLKIPEEIFASTHLSRLGHRIITAKDIADCADKLKDQKIDLIYLQISVDERAVQELEEMVRYAGPSPVVLLCAQPNVDIVRDAWHAGAVDVLSLPLSTASLDASLLRRAGQLAREEAGRKAASVQARFFYLDDAGKECWANVATPRFTIGRSSCNDLVLKQMGISRSHAEVLLQDGEYLVCDLDSKQGTFLNGVKVGKAKLVNGDRIQLGGSQGVDLAFHEGDLLQSLLKKSDSRSEISLSIHGFREVGMLFAAFRAFSSTAVLDDLLALVVDAAIELTGAERGFIMLKEGDGDLDFRCARDNHKRPLDGSCFQTSRRVPYDVFETGRPVSIKDLDLDDRSEDHSATRRLGLRSISCAPLRYMTVRDSANVSVIAIAETIGVLYVDSSATGPGLSATKMDALETLASEAAMAIYNAKLYKDSQDKRRMDEQLAFAREIQQALLPNSNKDLPFVLVRSLSIPCHEVGGDYFDYYELDRSCLGFAVGDVAGKGMPAALLASLLQGILSSQTPLDLPPATMISNVNHHLARRGTSSRFVTFFYGALDPEGNCTYVNAGHNPPFLLNRNGSMTELTVGGVVLGLFAGAQYEAETIKLQPGDHLVLFTDGVIEALNTAGEEFGMERLVSLLRLHAGGTAQQILDSLREAVLKFSANTPQHDDITMMVIGFRE